MKRISGLLFAFALLGSSLMAIAAESASAADVICKPYSTWYKVSGSPIFTLTHVSGYQAPPGGSFSRSRTASYQRKLGAGITVSSSGTVSGGAVLAKAEATFGVELAASGEWTKGTSETVIATVGASRSDRYYAAYAGRRYWSGRWEKKVCSSKGTVVGTANYGTWRSFQSNLEGIALCPASRYRAGSLPYKACRATWNG